MKARNLYWIGLLFIYKGIYDKAISYTLKAYSIFERLHSPGAKTAIANLDLIKHVIGESEVNKIVDEIEKNPPEL